MVPLVPVIISSSSGRAFQIRYLNWYTEYLLNFAGLKPTELPCAIAHVMREGMGKRIFISTKKCGGTISSFVAATMRLNFLEIDKRGL
jgi:hypothetical protein